MAPSGESQQSFESFEPESPFLETPGAQQNESRATAATTFEDRLWELDTPFQHDSYALEASATPMQAEFARLLSELKDEAFNDSVREMAAEAVAARIAPLSAEVQETEAGALHADQVLSEHFGPLAERAESMLEQFTQVLGRYDVQSLNEAEVDRLAEQLYPQAGALGPAQEQFLGGLWKKAKTLAKGAINLAKRGMGAIGRFGLGPIFNMLKKLVWPLLKRVIKFALGKLPANVWPYARKLAAKLIGVREAEGESETNERPSALQAAATGEHVQFEFDIQAAQLLFAADEAEMEAFTGESTGSASQYEDPMGDLHRARERLTADLAALKQGESAAPAIQNFLPAALLALRPVARAALSIVGRQRVIDFLAKLLARLIQRFIGPEGALALARATVDVGLSGIGLEVSEASSERVGNETVAATLEQTLTSLAMQPPHVFENETLMEAATMEAFEDAAQSNFPNQMLKPEFQIAPAGGQDSGSFVLMPRQQRRKYYKKYSVVREVTIQRPAVSSTVKTFGQATLEDFFSEQLMLPANKPVKAKLHVYEAICGTWLGYISQMETSVSGLGNYARATYFQFHPLTPEAAVALGVAGLGKEVAPEFLAGHEALAIQQRVYYLEIPGPRGVISPGSYVRVEIDLRASEVRAFIYISEKRCQEIAQELKNGGSIAGAVRTLVETLRAFLRTVRDGKAGRAVKVIRETLEPEQFTLPTMSSVVQAARSAASGLASAIDSAATNVVPGLASQAIRGAISGGIKDAIGKAGPEGAVASAVLGYVIDKVVDWLDSALGKWLVENRERFIQQASNPSKKGVTIVVTYAAGQGVLRTLLNAVQPALALYPTRIDLYAGPR